MRSGVQDGVVVVIGTPSLVALAGTIEPRNPTLGIPDAATVHGPEPALRRTPKSDEM